MHLDANTWCHSASQQPLLQPLSNSTSFSMRNFSWEVLSRTVLFISRLIPVVPPASRQVVSRVLLIWRWEFSIRVVKVGLLLCDCEKRTQFLALHLHSAYSALLPTPASQIFLKNSKCLFFYFKEKKNQLLYVGWLTKGQHHCCCKIEILFFALKKNPGKTPLRSIIWQVVRGESPEFWSLEASNI